MIKKNYKEYLTRIKTFIFDVDGVLTDGKVLVTSEGEMYRALDTKDGYGIKCALLHGFKIVIITGGMNEGIRKRFNEFGIYDIYLGAFNKMDAVTFGVPAADALKEEVQRIGGQRIFLMISGSLNRNTDEISKIRNALGNKIVGEFDKMSPHTPREDVIEA